jgi:2-polyprenyl-3-methyl-5-hydroxy-6-metoxy-1,4-benzoquinol methylase
LADPAKLGPEAYDDVYTLDDRTFEKFSTPYYALFHRVTEIAVAEKLSSVLEVGCGRGLMAELMVRAGIPYIGFDFNVIAVEKARLRNGAGRHFVADATDPASYSAPYDGIVCCEVLEHIEADLRVIELWRPGCICICSVPNFDYKTHVRFFRHEDEICARYGGLLDIQRIERVAKPVRAGLTWHEYFRKVRWSRDDPRKLLGNLGVNTFDWHSGWFVLVARRCNL